MGSRDLFDDLAVFIFIYFIFLIGFDNNVIDFRFAFKNHF